jgi:hypothetical protein
MPHLGKRKADHEQLFVVGLDKEEEDEDGVCIVAEVLHNSSLCQRRMR